MTPRITSCDRGNRAAITNQGDSQQIIYIRTKREHSLRSGHGRVIVELCFNQDYINRGIMKY